SAGPRRNSAAGSDAPGREVARGEEKAAWAVLKRPARANAWAGVETGAGLELDAQGDAVCARLAGDTHDRVLNPDHAVPVVFIGQIAPPDRKPPTTIGRGDP